MGYRNKIGILDKSLHEEIKRMTYKQLVEKFGEDDYAPCYEITKEIYEIGKYWEHDFLKLHTFPLFTRKATHKHFNDGGEFFGITKEGFQAIINSYKDMVLKYYTKMRDEKFEFFDTLHGDPVKNYFKDKVREWEYPPYSFQGESICQSWKYEYSVFELVRIYKSIDWEKQIVTITGW